MHGAFIRRLKASHEVLIISVYFFAGALTKRRGKEIQIFDKGENNMSKLRIAITADTYPYASDVTNLVRAPFTARGLVDVIHELGALPIVLPDVPDINGSDYAELFDALVLPGGPDMDPTFFGEEPTWKIGTTNYLRDVFETEIFRAFRASGKPIFGICRGCQLINTVMGGTIYQDLPSQNPDAYIRHSQAAPGAYPTHHITVEKDSVIAHALGETAYVNSRHHQAIRDVAPGLRATAKAPDGVVECVESADSDQIVAVQWHPENMWQEHPEMRALFADFIARAEAFRGK